MSWMLLIILLAVGVCFWILGWQIWKKEKITLLHDYHYAKVKPDDRKAYTGVMGKGALPDGGWNDRRRRCAADPMGSGWLVFARRRVCCGACRDDLRSNEIQPRYLLIHRRRLRFL